MRKGLALAMRLRAHHDILNYDCCDSGGIITKKKVNFDILYKPLFSRTVIFAVLD